MSDQEKVHPADQVLPVPQLFVLGLQHVLVMYAGAITVPIIIGGALGLPRDQIAFLISADLFACGIVSIIQSMGIWRFGARVPVMMGVTFASVPPMIIMARNPDLGIQGLFGSVIGAGVIILFIAPMIGKLIRFFPPVVTGTVITVTGLALMPIGINWAAGGQPMITQMVDSVAQRVPNPAYGSIEYIGLSAVVLLVILAFAKFGRGFLANISVLMGLLFGFAVTAAVGKVQFSGVAEADWFAVIQPFHFGLPIFHVGSILSMTVVMIIVMVETAGMLLAVGEMVDRRMDEKRIADGLRVDGLGTIIGGVFNTFPYVSYSQNVGLVGVTGVKSRWVCVMAGAIMIVLGLVLKLAVVAASIPIYVLGGAGIVMFGMVCATGIKILAGVNYAERGNLFIVSVSVVLGMIPVVSPGFYSKMPGFLAPITHSGIVAAALSAFLLNLYFFHLRNRSSEQQAIASSTA